MVRREKHANHVVHFAEQRLAEGGVLMRLLILAVLPGMRRRDQRPPQPACRPADLLLLTGEDDALAHHAEHLHAERLIAGHEVQPALVGQAGGDHGLFVERGDDGAVDRLQFALRLNHTVLERLEHATQPVARQLVRVAHPWSQRRVGLGQLDEEAIHRGHRRAGIVTILELRDDRRRRASQSQRIVAFEQASLTASHEQLEGRLKIALRHEKPRRMLVEQVAGHLV